MLQSSRQSKQRLNVFPVVALSSVRFGLACSWGFVGLIPQKHLQWEEAL